MIYYISKGIQALGLIIVLVAFLQKFPELMSPRLLGVGIFFFIIGWIIEKFLLQK